jgi:hypothetical protein
MGQVRREKGRVMKRELPVIPEGTDIDEWCIVQYRNLDGSIDILVRLKYQWGFQKLNGKWKYVAEGLTQEQAREFAKLF